MKPSLRIALEWFLNPDHLPLLAARDRLRDSGLDIELIVPDDHYDGFAALANGAVELVVNEPLHLVERQDCQLASRGCFFATDGGVLMHRAALEGLARGEVMRIASPVSNPTTDGLCSDILAGWLARRNVGLADGQITIEPAGFDHVDNLVAGFDGAWLAFANVEGVAARMRGLDTVLVTTAEAGVPGFSALELISLARPSDDVRAATDRLVEAIDAAIAELRADPAAARQLWYEASGEQPSAETDAIVDDTLPRFVAPVRPDIERWRPMWRYLHQKGGDVVDAETFEAMFR